MPSARAKTLTLVLCCLAQFMVVLDVSIVNVALPSIRADLDFSGAELQWIVSAYTLTFAGFLLLGGRAADLLGRGSLLGPIRTNGYVRAMQRRVDVGTVISKAFSLYGAQAGTLLPVAFALFLVVGVLQGLLTGPLILIGTLASLVAGTLYQGMVVRLVEDVQDGRRDFSAGDLLKSVTPVILPLILAGILVGLMFLSGSSC